MIKTYMKRTLMCFISIVAMFIMFNTTQIKAYSINYGDFNPIDPIEKTYKKDTNIGHWNRGGFFETVTMQKIGSDPVSGNEIYRFRYYITHRGDGGSYIYQKVPVALYIDGVARAQYMNAGRFSNRTALWGEYITTLEPGNHVVELKDIMPGAITVVNVRWDINIPVPRYIVTFLDYNGTLLKREVVKKGGNATPPPNPVREGHAFSGWNGNYTNVRKDETVVAQYALSKYTVNFLDYDNKLLKSEVVIHGGDASPPPNPIRLGYTFIKWDGIYKKVTSNRNIIATYTPTPPDIRGKESYFFQYDEVLIDKLAKRGEAKDDLDGDISDKVFIKEIEYHDRIDKMPYKLDTSKIQDVVVTFGITNSRNITSYAKAPVHIVKRGSDLTYQSSEPTVYARFISNEVLLDGKTPLDHLPANSIWRRPDYAAVLKEALESTEGLEEYEWINNPEIDEFLEGREPGEETNRLVVEKFGNN